MKQEKMGTYSIHKLILLVIPLFFLSSCLKSSISIKLADNKSSIQSNKLISGVISPFVSLIAKNNSSSLLISSANADGSLCAAPVYAKLFALKMMDPSIKTILLKAN